MIQHLRERYNSRFNKHTYQEFLNYFDQLYQKKVEFRIAETPVFIDKSFKELLIEAGNEILGQCLSDAYLKHSSKAIPCQLYVPHQTNHPHFIAIDFAVCQDSSGQFIPQLIELQGFASLFFWQDLLPRTYQKYFDIPEGFSHFFNQYTTEKHRQLMQSVILGNHRAENVILLEIEPEKQKTWIDFWETKTHVGIEPVCISKIKKEGRQLYYYLNGHKTPIHRIYNRVIFDELLQRKDLSLEFSLTDDVDVEWAGHPNWFFLISKFTMPFLKSRFAPECFFLNQISDHLPDDLSNYVLKPLYSFAGSGVLIDVTKEAIEKINPDQRAHFLLQRKVTYAPCVLTPDQPAKVEVRLLYVWKDGEQLPQLVLNLTRLSKGAMIGVSHNKNMDWVGGSSSLMEI
jgi:hypothetical protein